MDGYVIVLGILAAAAIVSIVEAIRAPIIDE